MAGFSFPTIAPHSSISLSSNHLSLPPFPSFFIIIHHFLSSPLSQSFSHSENNISNDVVVVSISSRRPLSLSLSVP